MHNAHFVREFEPRTPVRKKHDRPNKECQVKRLAHGSGLHVDEVGVRGEYDGGGPGSEAGDGDPVGRTVRALRVRRKIPITAKTYPAIDGIDPPAPAATFWWR